MALFESSNLSQEPLVKVNKWLQEAVKLQVLKPPVTTYLPLQEVLEKDLNFQTVPLINFL